MEQISNISRIRTTSNIKVGYFIFSNEHGTGGHHHSLKAISESLKTKADIDVHIINLGLGASPVLSSNSNYVFCYINEFSILNCLIKVVLYCRKYKINILHAFDANSYFYVRIISYILKIPSVYTKCGGANEKYNPKVNFATTFSKENYDFLIKKNLHKHLYLIENRIPKFEQNISKIEELRNKLDIHGKLTFLRIVRVSTYYKSSIYSTLRFVSNFDNAVLVIIGSIYDKDLFNEMSLIAKEMLVKVHFLTDKEFTSNAKLFLELGDIILGTGRAAMESMYLGKPLLSFVKGIDYPIIVNEGNFQEFKYYNFSERTNLSIIPSQKSVVDYIKNINFQEFRHNFLSIEFTKSYFVDTRIGDYWALYNAALTPPKSQLHIFDFFLNFYYHFLRASRVVKNLIAFSKFLKN